MICVIDYGVGNIGSVLNMIKKVGGQAVAIRDPKELELATKVLLPGVGSFDHAMAKLEACGFTQVLKDKAASGTPFLGICLGMQLLSNGSDEGGRAGLGLIPGRVVKFKLDERLDLKVPHMGWNKVRGLKQHALINDIADDSRFYFVHSYHYECEQAEDALLQTEYGYGFTSAVQRQNVMGVQFHPEKSHRYGMQLMRNFVEL